VPQRLLLSVAGAATLARLQLAVAAEPKRQACDRQPGAAGARGSQQPWAGHDGREHDRDPRDFSRVQLALSDDRQLRLLEELDTEELYEVVAVNPRVSRAMDAVGR